MGSVHNDLHSWAAKARGQDLDTIEIDLETADRAAQKIVDLSNQVSELEHQARRREADLLEANNRYLQRARDAEAKLDALGEARAGCTDPSQDSEGARYGVPVMPGQSTVTPCRAWFSSQVDASAWAEATGGEVWDLFKGQRLMAASDAGAT
jgi:hypothetical protein